MRDEGLDDVVLLPKAIDNSQVVREVDPRSNRDLFWLLFLVAALVAGMGLYAWPHFELREAAKATEKMRREREALLEENRKLRLEKAVLEDLRRIEAIASRELGMSSPAPERIVVVETPRSLPEGAREARGRDKAAPARN